MTKRLLIAVLLLGVLVAINPLLVRWAYLDWNKQMVVFAIAGVNARVTNCFR